jgi:hypothetical protein
MPVPYKNLQSFITILIGFASFLGLPGFLWETEFRPKIEVDI